MSRLEKMFKFLILKLKQSSKPTLAFFVIMIVALIFLAYPLWNYTKFHLAIWHLSCDVSDVTIDLKEIANYKIKISVQLVIMNPIDYSGLELSSAMVGLQYINGEHTIRIPHPANPYSHLYITTTVWDLKTETHTLKLPIDPSEKKIVQLDFIINPRDSSLSSLDRDNAWLFIGFVNSLLKSPPPQEISWLLNLRLFISSFLTGFELSHYLPYVTVINY